MNSTTIYGRQAYEGFARAIGAKLGLAVKVADGASPCIDADGTIYLPAMNTYQTAQEFQNTCASIVHELSHQFYNSHGQIDPNRSRLEHDCLNAVLDVADESGIAQWFAGQHGNKRPGELLDVSNSHALYSNQGLYDWDQPNHAWKVLVTGILDARLPRQRHLLKVKRFNAWHSRQRGVDAKKCWRIMRRAKLAKNDNGQPTAKRFPRLIKLAQELASILQPFAPPANQPPAPSPLEGALTAGTATAGGRREATAADGAAIADGSASVDGSGAAGAGAGASGDGSQSGRAASESAFRMLYPAVERIGQRIATDGDGIALEDALASGPVLGQVYRLATDGQCLARWQVNEHADGLSVAVLLDCSGSMSHRLRECAGIARAFAVGMRQCGEVLSLVFGSTCTESADFASVRTMGGTNTEIALRQAREWLATRRGARWIVVVTDGEPHNKMATIAECNSAQAAGIRMLAIGLGCSIDGMPGAIVATAADNGHLAIELEAAASIMERN